MQHVLGILISTLRKKEIRRNQQ